MKRFGVVLIVLHIITRLLTAQSEAGAIFLLIAPGARAGGMGEAQVAVANDAYASYWNPAGLGFLKGSEAALMHVNWLPGLADDMYYEFFGFRKHYNTLGTLGGHIIFLNLGEQVRTSEIGEELGTFTSYMTAFSLSYGALISEKKSFGINAKISYQHLVEIGAGSEKGKGTSLDFGFDIGYLQKDWLIDDLDIGFNLSNIGPKVSFIDPDQADPQPTNLTLGLNYGIVNTEYNKLNLVYDVDKLLVASYPDMDWDDNGYIGGYDEDGNQSPGNDYNKKGQIEIAHTDPIYLALFTSWVDDWFLGGNIDRAVSGEYGDKIIGGWTWDDSMDLNENNKPDANEMVRTDDINPGGQGWGKYNEWGQKEVGNSDDRSLSDELDKLVHNFGLEYWYGKYFAIRTGYYYDKTGKISNPTFGIVQGTVTDSITGIPIEYASVSIIDNHDGTVVTGGLSKKDGSFNIREIPLGQYIVLIEFIGYAKKEIGPLNIFPGEGGSIENFIGEIALKISSVNLDAVEVIGDESQFIQTVDKQIFKVGKNLTAAGGTGFDLLRKVPTVDVNIDGEVSIAGDANVTILIDGKRSGLTGSNRRGVVDNIQVAMVEKVEVITNPSAKYDPDGVGGIINIVLKRGAFDGLNGSISGMAGEYEKRNLNGTINYRAEKWNIFAGSSTRSGNNIGRGYREFTYQYPDHDSSLYQNTLRIKNPANVGMRLGGDYYPSKSSTISYTYMFGHHDEVTKEELEYITPELGKTESKEEDHGLHHDHSISYENKFGTKDRKLTASLDLNFEEDESVQHNVEASSVWDDHTHDHDTEFKEKNESQTFRIDYEDDLNEALSIETGIKATMKSFSTDYNYLEQLYSNNYDEDIYAAYASLKYDITDRFGIKAGARFEQVETNATLIPSSANEVADSVNIISTIINNAVEASPYKNPYTKVYPSLYLIYKLSPMQTIQFGYSKKVNRPGRRTISPFPRNTFDISRIRNGNPYLDPEYSDGAELKFSSNSRKLNFNAGLTYKLIKDNIMWWDRDMIEFEGDVYEILTADNSENSESMGSSLVINYRPMPLVSIMFSRWGWKNRTYGNGESDLNGDSKGAYNRGMVTVNIPRVVRLELTVGGRGKMEFTTGSSPGSFSTDIGLQKSFLDNRLSVTVKLDDVFDTKKFIINTEHTITHPITNEVYTQLMNAERRRQQRYMSINLNYNFGKQQKKRWTKRNFGGGRSGGGGMDMDY